MDPKLIKMVEEEEGRGLRKWGVVDRTPEVLLNAAAEELGEVAHAINHGEGLEAVQQEVAETIGILSRLWVMAGRSEK